MVKNLPALRESWVQSLGQEDPQEKGMVPTPLFMPGEFHGQRNLAGYSAWGCKESDMANTSLHFGACKALNSCFQFLVEAAIYIVYISSSRLRNVK